MEKGQKNILDPNPPMKLIGKKNTLFVNFEVQEINNKKCQLHSTTKNLHVNSIWVNGVEKFHWFYTFRYTCGGGFTIEINHYDNIVKFKEI